MRKRTGRQTRCVTASESTRYIGGKLKALGGLRRVRRHNLCGTSRRKGISNAHGGAASYETERQDTFPPVWSRRFRAAETHAHDAARYESEFTLHASIDPTEAPPVTRDPWS